MSVSQAGALVSVKAYKSERSSLTDCLVFDKTCTASLDTILFIERTNKIEDNRPTLYKTAFSTNSPLLRASYMWPNKS
jgi:hypothetical protein